MAVTTAATTTTGAVPVTTAVSGPLAGFETIEVAVGGRPWRVALADTPALRSLGLMGVTGLGGLDGMLFLWDGDTTSRFHMKNTLIPLDIAFFRADGSLVDLLSMVPCDTEPCPTYRAGGPYRAAIEVPAGGFDGISDLQLALP